MIKPELIRKIRIDIQNISSALILKLTNMDDFPYMKQDPVDCCLIIDSPESVALLGLSWGAILLKYDIDLIENNCRVIIRDNELSLSSGDVILVNNKGIDVLYRKGGNSNLLFVTERCNHNCVMCSQPPKNIDDLWRLDECHKLIDMIDDNEEVLGISGGEPTLLGDGFVELLQHCKNALPNTMLHILTNATFLNDKDYLNKILSVEHDNILWGIPIYGCTPYQHDFNVQSKGAFNNTINAIYNLECSNQKIELRLVLTKQVLDDLENITEYILRNLPFVHVVAFMGLELIGHARGNQKLVLPNILEYSNLISNSILTLSRLGLNPLLYNLPLCYLNEDVRDYAVKSISDWKNVFFDNCYDCEKRDDCCGFFSSHYGRYVSQEVLPIRSSDGYER